MAVHAPPTTPSLHLRGLLARSNRALLTRLPARWIYWLAWPHEIWHYLAARLLGLPAQLVPGATLYRPSARWQRILVLLAPAVAGLVFPFGYECLRAALSGQAVTAGGLLLMALAWWAGCAGDFIDVWLLATRRETAAEHRARMRSMVERFELSGR
jgi:hypothetical protein